MNVDTAELKVETDYTQSGGPRARIIHERKGSAYIVATIQAVEGGVLISTEKGEKTLRTG